MQIKLKPGKLSLELQQPEAPKCLLKLKRLEMKNPKLLPSASPFPLSRRMKFIL